MNDSRPVWMRRPENVGRWRPSRDVFHAATTQPRLPRPSSVPPPTIGDYFHGHNDNIPLPDLDPAYPEWVGRDRQRIYVWRCDPTTWPGRKGA